MMSKLSKALSRKFLLKAWLVFQVIFFHQSSWAQLEGLVVYNPSHLSDADAQRYRSLNFRYTLQNLMNEIGLFLDYNIFSDLSSLKYSNLFMDQIQKNVGKELVVYTGERCPQDVHLDEGITFMRKAIQIFNSSMFTKPTFGIKMESIPVPSKDLTFYRFTKRADDLLKAIVEEESGNILVPVHPCATKSANSSDKPIFGADPEKFTERFVTEGHFSASRSIFLTNTNRETGEEDHFMVKSSTNNILPPSCQFYSRIYHDMLGFKEDMKEDIATAKISTDIIQARDKLLSPSHHILIPEAGAVYYPKEKTGFIVRDLSSLDKNKLYIPGHGISSIGKLISNFHGVDFDSYWEKHYIIPLAKQKVELLLRYGLQMETPNAQNYLIEIDPETMGPSGKLAMWDISDMVGVDHVRRAYGMPAVTRGLEKFWHSGPLRINAQNSMAKFLDETILGDSAITGKTFARWKRSHALAYLMEMEKQLEVIIPVSLEEDRNYLKKLEESYGFPEDKWTFDHAISRSIDEFLNSAQGQKALFRYKQKQGESESSVVQVSEIRPIGL